MKRTTWFFLASAILIFLTVLSSDIRTNIGDFFFSGQSDDSNLLIGQLQSEELSRRYLVGLSHKDLDSETTFNFIQTFHEKLSTLPEVKRVWSGQLNPNDLEELLEIYQPHSKHLFSLQPNKAYPELLNEEGLNDRAKLIKESLFGPDPGQVKTLISTDPMLLTFSWLKKLQGLSKKSQSQNDYTTFLIETQSSGLDTNIQTQVLNDIRSLFEQSNQEINAGFELQITGVPVFALEIKRQISSDIQRVTTLSTLAMSLLFLFVFRSLRALFITASILVATISVATLTTQLFFGFVHGLTLALGITLVGICVDYIIHGMVHATNKTQQHRKNALQKIWPSLILGGITTIIGYAAISMSGFPGLQQIAIFAASGIITALLITRYVLPGLMDTFKLNIQPRIQTTSLLKLTQQPYTRSIVLVSVFLCFLFGFNSMQWSNGINTLTPALEELKQQDQLIRSRSISIEPGRFIVVEGNNQEQALVNAEKTQRLLNQLKEAGNIQTFYSVYPWLASEALQQQNQQQWNQAVSNSLQERWNSALQKQGLSAQAFPPLQTTDIPFLTIEKIKSSPAWPIISQQIIQKDDKSIIIIWLDKHNSEAVKQALSTLPHSRYFSQKDSINQLALEYREKAFSLLLWGLAAICFVLTVRYRSIQQALWILTPAVLSILAVLGLWGLSNNPMSILNLIGLLLVAAICVDYGIFYFENRSGDKALTFKAITVSALTTFVSFACLGVSETPAMLALAGTVAPGVLFGFILCPIMLRKQLH